MKFQRNGFDSENGWSNKTKNEINHDLSTLINSWNQIKKVLLIQ